MEVGGRDERIRRRLFSKIKHFDEIGVQARTAGGAFPRRGICWLEFSHGDDVIAFQTFGQSALRWGLFAGHDVLSLTSCRALTVAVRTDLLHNDHGDAAAGEVLAGEVLRVLRKSRLQFPPELNSACQMLLIKTELPQAIPSDKRA